MENVAPAQNADVADVAEAVPDAEAAPDADAPEAAARSGPVWRFLFQPRWLLWHVTMVVSFWGMGWLGDWQFHRAMSGNALSWAYTFEWPLFSVFAVVFWAKTIRDEIRLRRGQVLGEEPGRREDLPYGVGIIPVTSAQSAVAAQDEDEDLSAYNAYLARLNSEVKNHGKWHGLR